MSRCLVTGGAGFIGSHLTEELLKGGHHVTVLDNLSTGRAENLKTLEGHPRLVVRSGSITDQLLVAEVVREADVIYHLAAAVGVKLVADDPVRTIETNIYPTDTLLQLAVQGGGKAFFLASTSELQNRYLCAILKGYNPMHAAQGSASYLGFDPHSGFGSRANYPRRIF